MKKIILLLFICLSTDAYAQWKEVYRSNSYIFDQLYFINNETGFALFNGKDHFLKTTNGFDSQESIVIPEVFSIKEIAFYDSQNGFALGSYDNLYRTGDGGETWSVNLLDYEDPLYLSSMETGGADTIYVAGRKLLRSTNNGTTWQVIADYGDLFAEHDETMYERETIISFSLENRNQNLFISNYLVYRTADDGQTLRPVTLPVSGKYILSHHFVSSYVVNNSIYLLSNSRGIPENLFNSDDFGETWKIVNLPVRNYKQVQGINEDTVYVVGSEGSVLQSYDGFETWEEIIIHPEEVINDIFFTEDRTGYLVTNRKIYKNQQYSFPTSKEENPDEVKQFHLRQNYPNPFNPATNIQFTLRQAAQIELSVYTVLGRKVEVLYKGYKSSGNHTFTFNAANLAGGVYFYELRTEKGVKRKKMTLVK